MQLAWIFQVWDWTKDDRVFFGVTLLLMGAFAAGWIVGLETHNSEDQVSDRWKVIGVVGLLVGVGVLLWKPR